MLVLPPDISSREAPTDALEAEVRCDDAAERIAHAIHELLLNDTPVTDRALLEKGFSQAEIDTAIGPANTLVRRLWPALAHEADLVQ